MAVSEWVVSVYFAALTLVAWLRPVGPARRRHASALGVAVLITTVGAGLFAPDVVQAWAPIAYLIAGYWMPALLVTRGTDARFEEWLVRTDSQLRRFFPAVPRSLGHVVELGYLLCYPLVPLSFAVVWLTGDAADVERFWLAVLLSGYACYVTLPWLVSRPPRLQRDQDVRRGGVAQLNARVLGRVSHRLNTFPSGHVAVAAAAAASVASVSVPAGAVLAGVAAAISVGAAAGGYHYVIDVIFGFAVAATAVIVSGLI
jgi:membrane-associated phospholipid phosphatase